jgi:hypothetical protein
MSGVDISEEAVAAQASWIRRLAMIGADEIAALLTALRAEVTRLTAIETLEYALAAQEGK